MVEIKIPHQLGNQMKTFRDTFSKKKSIRIFCDTDPDGISAGFLLKKAAERLGIDAEAEPVDRDAVAFDDKKAYIVADIAISKSIIEKAKTAGVKILAIDHHPWDEGWEDVVESAVNARLLERPGEDLYYWNTGLVTFLAFRDVLSDYSWLAAVANFADKANKTEELNRFIDAHDRKRVEIVAQMLGLAEHFPEEITEREMLAILDGAKGIDDIINHPKLQDLYYRFKMEVDRFTSDPKQHAVLWDEAKKIMVLRLESDIRKIKSPVSSILGDKYPDWIVIVCQPWKGKIDCSLRAVQCQERNVHMGEWAKEFASLSNGRGGGHPVAAGLKFPEEYWEQFVEWVKKKIGQL